MWIKQAGAFGGEFLPTFTKKFDVSGNVSRCELEITATGIFTVKINDFEIPDRFMPGWTNYKKYIDVVKYDITDNIKARNVIEVTVANGWYKGKLGYGNRTDVFGDDRKLYAAMHIEYDDGKSETVETDESWEVYPSNVKRADFFDGETIDARNGCNCKKPLYKSIKADFSVQLSEYSNAAARVKEILNPEILYKDETTIRYDFKKNFAGVISFFAHGREGDRVKVKYAEVLNDDGTLYTANLRRAKCEDEMILSGDEDYFEPKFTYHGFRYAEITKPKKSNVTDVKGLLITQDIDYYGFFECSDKVMNGVFEMAKNGQKSNFISIPTDCPQRDERLGWTGDAEVFCNSAMFNADCEKFFANFMKLVRTDVLPDGKVPSIVPFYVPVAPNTAGVPGWADCIAVMPYHHYLHYRDDKIVKDNIEACEKWIGYYLSKSENYIVNIENNFGDWLSPDDKTDKNLINQCFFGYSSALTSKMFAVIGNKEKSVKYFEIFEKSREAFRKKYCFDGKLTNETQTAYALAYSVGFLSAGEIKQRLSELVKKSGTSLTTGFIGSRFLLPALCDVGETELAYELVAKKDYPSWGYMLENGATTVWERWNGYTRENGFEDPEMNSFNHYSLGACVEWIYTYVLGIKLSGKTDKIVISPSFSNKIAYARGGTKVCGGKISVNWKREKTAITLEVVADENVNYEVEIKGAKAISENKSRGKTIVKAEIE